MFSAIRIYIRRVQSLMRPSQQDVFEFRQALSELDITDSVVTFEMVASNFWKLMKIWHPDLHQDPKKKARAEERAKRINHARDVALEFLQKYPGCGSISFPSTSSPSPGRPGKKAKRESGAHPFFEALYLEEIRVRSAAIRSIAYDGDAKNVYVRFMSDAIYCFEAVELQVWKEFLASGSKGQFIRYLNNYRYSRVS